MMPPKFLGSPTGFSAPGGLVELLVLFTFHARWCGIHDSIAFEGGGASSTDRC